MVATVLTFDANLAMPHEKKCPSTIGGNHLTNVDVYDGPISEMADLMPGDGGWNLEYTPASKKGFYLACRYGRAVIEIPLPANIKSCRFEHYPDVSCR